MYLKSLEINNKLSVSEIVATDYRTAEVFRLHGISYCCGGKWPLDMACEIAGVDIKKISKDLEHATRQAHGYMLHDFENWDIDFLIDYIITIHHSYLKKNLPSTQQLLAEFAKEHSKKFSWLADLEKKFALLVDQLQFSMKEEENNLFPYIRQLVHAHRDKEPYALLLVKTLRKPLGETMSKSYRMITGIILHIRELTSTYCSPENVCTSHKVVLAKLLELDQDIMQHLYLEEAVLFPRAIAIEKEMLAV